MDTAGHGAGKKRLPDGGPGQDDDTKFRAFGDHDVRDMWTYHAVAAVIRGHSLLASLPEVDPHRIGITGISWGGYLTCLVAGLDERLKVAVPVYGCGFLGENSVWKPSRFDDVPEERRTRWTQTFDPSSYLSGVSCPILFLNGTTDFAYPLDSYRKSALLVPEPLRSVSIQVNLPHGHIWTFPEVDAFVDAALVKGSRVPRFGPLLVRDGVARARILNPGVIQKAEVHYTRDTGPWQQRKWVSGIAEFRNGEVLANVPSGAPVTLFVSAVNLAGLRVSSLHAEVP